MALDIIKFTGKEQSTMMSYNYIYISKLTSHKLEMISPIVF